MRGAFVACFGERADLELLARVAGAHRWHNGTPEHHFGGPLQVAMQVDDLHGPRLTADGERTMVVHGERSGTRSELERRGERFVAVDCDARTLLASRDPLGLCPLFYRVVDRVLWLSSEVAPLVALGGARPDLAALAFQVALAPLEDHTGWSEIFRVLPGHRLRASSDLRIVQERYWNADRLVSTYQGTRAEAEAELQARLIAAVDRCLDDESGVLVSGGLDSAAIALSTGGRKPRLVHVTFPDYSGANEVGHARAIAEFIGAELDVVTGDTSPWDPAADLLMSAVPYVSPPQLTADRGLVRLAERGCRTALDGNDGDGMLGYGGREWGELVLTGRVRRLAQLARSHGLGATLHGLIDDLVPPDRRLRSLRGKPPPAVTYLQQIERYFDAPLRERMRDADHDRWRPPRGEWRARQVRQVMPVTTTRMEEHELRAARHGLDMRHPFADRELVEFLISLPAWIKTDPFRTKAMLRSSLAARGPATVLERPDKPLYYDVLGGRTSPDRCLEWIRASGVELPLIDYARLYHDAARRAVPEILLIFLARAHVFAAAAG